MDKKEYQKYLANKYGLYTQLKYNSYARIDAMLSFNEIISRNESLIFKGALNLYKNHGYAREKLTKDIDYSISGQDIAEFAKSLSSHEFSHNIYVFKIDESYKELIISSNLQYGGIKMRVEVVAPVKHSFTFDIAVEEAKHLGILEGKYQRYYSVERTLAEKYVSMYQHLHVNTRAKDLIDIKNLLKDANYNHFLVIVKSLIDIRKITHEARTSMHSNYAGYKIVRETKTKKIIEKIINKIKN